MCYLPVENLLPCKKKISQSCPLHLSITWSRFQSSKNGTSIHSLMLGWSDLAPANTPVPFWVSLEPKTKPNLSSFGFNWPTYCPILLPCSGSATAPLTFKVLAHLNSFFFFFGMSSACNFCVTTWQPLSCL